MRVAQANRNRRRLSRAHSNKYGNHAKTRRQPVRASWCVPITELWRTCRPFSAIYHALRAYFRPFTQFRDAARAQASLSVTNRGNHVRWRLVQCLTPGARCLTPGIFPRRWSMRCAAGSRISVGGGRASARPPTMRILCGLDASADVSRKRPLFLLNLVYSFPFFGRVPKRMPAADGRRRRARGGSSKRPLVLGHRLVVWTPSRFWFRSNSCKGWRPEPRTRKQGRLYHERGHAVHRR